MQTNLYVSIDFDGTITDADITDAVIQRFARPGWEEAERLWEEGVIGSKECLEAQFSLIDAPLNNILEYVDTYSIDKGFKDFIAFLKGARIPFGIISDGFQVIIERMLSNAGISRIPVYANHLTSEGAGGAPARLKTSFPYHNRRCASGVCKSEVARTLGNGVPVVHIGDGRSDFCIAEEAQFVYSKGKLTTFCKEKGIPCIEFLNFSDVKNSMAALVPKATLTALSRAYVPLISAE